MNAALLTEGVGAAARVPPLANDHLLLLQTQPVLTDRQAHKALGCSVLPPPCRLAVDGGAGGGGGGGSGSGGWW